MALQSALNLFLATARNLESHKFLVAKGFAQKLHAFKRLPGGLCMDIMDDICEEYVSLFNLVRDNPSLSSEVHLGSCDVRSK